MKGLFRVLLCTTAVGVHIIVLAQTQAANAPPPRRLLLVTTTLGFHHTGVEIQEKLVRQLASSTGKFTVVSTTDSPDYPAAEYKADEDARNARIPLSEAGDNDQPPFLDMFGGLGRTTKAQETAVTAIMKLVAPFARKASAARMDYAETVYSGHATEAELTAKSRAWSAAELELAEVRAKEFAKLQASPEKLRPFQMQILLQLATRGTFADYPMIEASQPAPAQQAAIESLVKATQVVSTSAAHAREALDGAPFAATSKADLNARATEVEKADISYGKAVSAEIAKIQASSAPLTNEQQFALAQTVGLPFTYGLPRETNPLTDKVAKVLAQYMSPESLKKYDAVAFLCTTGELPIPDKEAFFRWVHDGHGFVGLHSATDTLHGTPEYIEMVGGEFAGHGMFHPKAEVVNVDPSSPITAGWGKSITLNEEFYLIRKFDPKTVHVLLEMEAQPYTHEPGKYPVSWIKNYGSGRVFYSSLGHRDDVLQPDAAIGDQEYKVRYNQPGVAEAVDRHILQGIEWALGLIEADATPQATQ